MVTIGARKLGGDGGHYWGKKKWMVMVTIGAKEMGGDGHHRGT